LKNVNFSVTGTCEAEVICKRQICIRKYWACTSCF